MLYTVRSQGWPSHALHNSKKTGKIGPCVQKEGCLKASSQALVFWSGEQQPLGKVWRRIEWHCSKSLHTGQLLKMELSPVCSK